MNYILGQLHKTDQQWWYHVHLKNSKRVSLTEAIWPHNLIMIAEKVGKCDEHL